MTRCPNTVDFARPELSEICVRVAKRSGGNPFFAEELVSSLADDRVLSGDEIHSAQVAAEDADEA